MMEVPDIKGLISIGAARLDQRKLQPAGPEAKAEGPADKVELSSDAAAASRALEAQQAQNRAAAQERADMLVQIKLEYTSGKLNINSQSIAERMVAEGIFDEFNGA